MQIWKSANTFVFIWKHVEDFTVFLKFIYKHSDTIECFKSALVYL